MSETLEREQVEQQFDQDRLTVLQEWLSTETPYEERARRQVIHTQAQNALFAEMSEEFLSGITPDTPKAEGQQLYADMIIDAYRRWFAARYSSAEFFPEGFDGKLYANYTGDLSLNQFVGGLAAKFVEWLAIAAVKQVDGQEPKANDIRVKRVMSAAKEAFGWAPPSNVTTRSRISGRPIEDICNMLMSLR